MAKASELLKAVLNSAIALEDEQRVHLPDVSAAINSSVLKAVEQEDERIFEVFRNDVLIKLINPKDGEDVYGGILDVDMEDGKYTFFFKAMSHTSQYDSQIWDIITMLLDELGLSYKAFTARSGRIYTNIPLNSKLT